MAAREGLTECVRVLVETGADVKAAPHEETFVSWVAGETLLCAADGGWRRDYPLKSGEELKGLSCLKYLLPFYDPERPCGGFSLA